VSTFEGVQYTLSVTLRRKPKGLLMRRFLTTFGMTEKAYLGRAKKIPLLPV